MSSATAKPSKTQRNLPPHLWKPGQSGNPKGAAPGVRRKIEQVFLEDMLAAWKERGRETIRRVIDEEPSVYLRVMATLLPRQVEVQPAPLEEVDDDELGALLAAARAAIALVRTTGAGGDESNGQGPTASLPTLQ